ncbi:MAG: glycerol kinase [Dehalococcoidia bacterium]|nr:glycerol kinase [Dehalococcoidia bacterium]
MSGDYILAIDQGTTATTVLVVDRTGAIVGRGAAAVQQSYPHPGWVEHDPDQLWATVLAATGEALAAARLAARDAADRLAAVGITNQRETTILWERATGRPVAPAIVWQCRRTAADCAALEEAGLGSFFRDRTGLVLDAYFSGTKISWLLNQDSQLRRRAEAGEIAFGTVDAWLVWQLTGGQLHATDVTNASRTLLFNLQSLSWDDELLAALDVPAAVLPRVLASSGDWAETRSKGPIPAGVPIAGIAGDQQAALFGQACFGPGTAKTTYGTGCFLLMQTGDRPVQSENGLLTTIAWQLPDRVDYALEGSVFIGGAAVQWLRDEMDLLASAAESDAAARRVADSGGVVCVPAFAGLGAPYWDPYARGLLIGLTRSTTRDHIVRAVLEGIAHQVADVLAAMTADAGIRVPELRVDGGAAANDFLMQLQGDLLGIPVVRPAALETTALGAAFLAGIGIGWYASTDEVARTWQSARRFQPSVDSESSSRSRAQWQRAVQRSRAWASDE